MNLHLHSPLPRHGIHKINFIFLTININFYTSLCRFQRLRGLRRRSTAARLLRSWVRIPPAAWMFVCCECRVLSDRSLCDELITRPEESYRLWCVVVCDIETSRMRRPWPNGGCCAKNKQTLHFAPVLKQYHPLEHTAFSFNAHDSSFDKPTKHKPDNSVTIHFLSVLIGP